MYSGNSGHVYSGHSDIVATFSSTKYHIQVGYSGQSDIVARKGWPKVATISEVHCKNMFQYQLRGLTIASIAEQMSIAF